MPVIAVVNPKGGVGKTTVATNIAGYFAARGEAVMLGDFDKQGSAKGWLDRRPEAAVPIRHWEIAGSLLRPPRDVTHVVLDTPAQVDDWRLSSILRLADRVVVPLQPSSFDMDATAKFLHDLKDAFRYGRRFEDVVVVVGNRVDARTRAAEQLGHFLEDMGAPVAGFLRDTQNYVQLAAHGLTMFDVPERRVEQDLASWGNLLGVLNAQ